jgi:hypothetical protein
MTVTCLKGKLLALFKWPHHYLHILRQPCFSYLAT